MTCMCTSVGKWQAPQGAPEPTYQQQHHKDGRMTLWRVPTKLLYEIHIS